MNAKYKEKEFIFSEGFDDLHTRSYAEILCGNGFECTQSREAIELIHHIRHSTPIGIKGEYHPLNAKVQVV